MNTDWMDRLPIEKLHSILNLRFNHHQNSLNVWKVALGSAAGLILSGTLGYYYIKYREQVDENESVNTLAELAQNVWSARYTFQMSTPPVAVTSNMFVIRLTSGLLIYNPIKLTPHIKKQIDSLGEVKFIFVSNRDHLSFFADFVEKYPNVRLFCPPGSINSILEKLNKRKLGLPTNGLVEMQENVAPEDVWTHQEMEHHVFQGIPRLNEIFLFHKPSGIMFITDLGSNLRSGQIKLKNPTTTPLLVTYARKFGILDKIGVSSFLSYFIKDKEMAKRSLAKVCGWDFKGLAMAHGVPILSDDTVKASWKAELENLLK